MRWAFAPLITPGVLILSSSDRALACTLRLDLYGCTGVLLLGLVLRDLEDLVVVEGYN